MEKTHTYPTIPSDDQPDRSAAHNNLADTYWYTGQVRLTEGPQTVTPTLSLRIATFTSRMVKRPIPMLLTCCFCRLGCHG